MTQQIAEQTRTVVAAEEIGTEVFPRLVCDIRLKDAWQDVYLDPELITRTMVDQGLSREEILETTVLASSGMHDPNGREAFGYYDPATKTLAVNMGWVDSDLHDTFVSAPEYEIATRQFTSLEDLEDAYNRGFSFTLTHEEGHCIIDARGCIMLDALDGQMRFSLKALAAVLVAEGLLGYAVAMPVSPGLKLATYVADMVLMHFTSKYMVPPRNKRIKRSADGTYVYNVWQEEDECNQFARNRLAAGQRPITAKRRVLPPMLELVS